MSLIDKIRGRANVVNRESEGLDSAYRLVEKHNERTYVLKGSRKTYSGLTADALRERLSDEMKEAQIIYRYSTRTREYTDRRGRMHLEITIIGKAGMRGRYNPWDVEMKIKTEN